MLRMLSEETWMLGRLVHVRRQHVHYAGGNINELAPRVEVA